LPITPNSWVSRTPWWQRAQVSRDRFWSETEELGSLDGVDAVAICAYRGKPVAARNRLPVDALHVDALDLAVALPAGLRHVELVDQRLGVVGGQNVVGAMAVRAHRRALRSLLHRAPMHALLVRHKRLRAVAGRLHQELLPVAGPAGRGNVGVVDRRLCIAGRQNPVRIAMAIDAGRDRAAVRLLRRGVEAVLVLRLRVGMALHAGDLGRSIFVRRRLDVLVAVHAGEHLPVNGLLHLVRIDVQAHLLAARVRR